jgi:hypothetical protein
MPNVRNHVYTKTKIGRVVIDDWMKIFIRGNYPLGVWLLCIVSILIDKYENYLIVS